jgi:hypothetical protein
VKSHEAALHQQTKEIQMLQHMFSDQEEMIFKLNRMGMYAFGYVCCRVKSMDYRSVQYDILSVKMFLHVCLEV